MQAILAAFFVMAFQQQAYALPVVSSRDCDPRYPCVVCVPISSDVDCDGGKGDGPVCYFPGPAKCESPDDPY